MSNQFDYFLDSLKNQQEPIKSKKEWLMNIVGWNMAQSLTEGTYASFKEYCSIVEYYEEINLISSQNTGIKGICISNVKIVVNRGISSKKIIDAFKNNTILETVKLVQVMKRGSSFKPLASITFSTCKLTNAKLYLDYSEFYFQYSSRDECYISIDNSGSYSGNV